MMSHRTALPSRRPLFYYVTDRTQLPPGAIVESIRRAAAWGVDVVQVREKDLTDRELYDLVLRAARACRRSSCRVVVNGRADVALAAGASGVHLPAAGLKVDVLRRVLPRRFLIGVSTHTPEEAGEAGRNGADYVLFGPVYPTPSKLGYGPPPGLDSLEKACRACRVPVLALGGMTLGRIEPALGRGAAGIAGISMFQSGFPRNPGAPEGGLGKTSKRLIHSADDGI